MPYVDGFVLLVPKKNLKAYTKLASKAAKIWREYGALDYCECVGDDLDVNWGFPFPKLTKAKPTEAVVFSYILYKSRADRARICKKVMADPRLADCMDPKKMPFDMKKMSAGGFKPIVRA